MTRMSRPRALAGSLAGLLLSVSACGGTADPTGGTNTSGDGSNGDGGGASTTRLGAFCPDAGCAEGQSCITAAGPDGDTQTCEIRCTSGDECPAGYRCNTPPVVPGSIVNVCVR